MAEQRYQAVLAVIGEGSTVSEVAGRRGVSRPSVHAWLARYEAGGLEGLAASMTLLPRISCGPRTSRTPWSMLFIQPELH